MRMNDETYRTRSLYAAAFLLACDFPLLGSTLDSQGRTEFAIGGDARDVEGRLAEYRSGKALINAQRFGSELRRLKAILHGSD
jgi:hypothetical protein